MAGREAAWQSDERTPSAEWERWWGVARAAAQEILASPDDAEDVAQHVVFRAWTRGVTVTSFLRTGYVTDRVTRDVLSRLETIDLPADYRIVAAGEIESRQESFGGGSAVIVPMFMILAILVLEFGTFRSMFIVASVIPLGVAAGRARGGRGPARGPPDLRRVSLVDPVTELEALDVVPDRGIDRRLGHAGEDAGEDAPLVVVDALVGEREALHVLELPRVDGSVVGEDAQERVPLDVAGLTAFHRAPTFMGSRGIEPMVLPARTEARPTGASSVVRPTGAPASRPSSSDSDRGRAYAAGCRQA